MGKVLVDAASHGRIGGNDEVVLVPFLNVCRKRAVRGRSVLAAEGSVRRCLMTVYVSTDGIVDRP